MKLNTKVGRAAAVVATTAVVLTGAGAATASPGDGPYTGRNIVDGTLNQVDLNPQVVSLLRSPRANGVFNYSLNDGVVTENKLHPDVREQLGVAGEKGEPGEQGEPGEKGEKGDPASDVFGKAVIKDFEPVTIVNIGGSFVQRNTVVGDLTLPAGTWSINTTAVFARKIAGAEGTRIQLALRNKADGSGDFGTVLGTEISETKDRELVDSTTKTVVLTEETGISLRAFGYNDDTSAAGSGEIEVSAQVTAVRVG